MPVSPVTPPTNLRVVFMGTPGDYARTALKAVLDAGYSVCSVVVPGGRQDVVHPGRNPRTPRIPIARPESLTGLASDIGIPVRAVNDIASHEIRAELAALTVDVILVACFPYILPSTLLGLPRCGCLNLHPSLLPAYRGPTPLFWQFRAGESRAGVTMHLMSEQIDAGDIVAQRSLPLPPGISGPEANFQLARLGAGLIAPALHALARRALAHTAQDDAKSSYFPRPEPEHFRVSANWSAERAYRFMRGTAEWGQPYAIRCGDRDLPLGSALSYSPQAKMRRRWMVRDGEARIQFSRGVLRASVWQGSSHLTLAHCGDETSVPRLGTTFTNRRDG